MPGTTVQELFNQFNIGEYKEVSWGSIFQECNQGVYIVSTSKNPSMHLGTTVLPIFNDDLIRFWIDRLPNFTVDGVRATIANVKKRLSEFWFPDESILYIGKAETRDNETGISARVIEYYSTKIGSKRPHSGGQWIKTLQNLSLLTVYYGICDDPADIEHKMLEYFISNVSKETLEKLCDKNMPIPFANIRHKGDKKHGFKNQRS